MLIKTEYRKDVPEISPGGILEKRFMLPKNDYKSAFERKNDFFGSSLKNEKGTFRAGAR